VTTGGVPEKHFESEDIAVDQRNSIDGKGGEKRHLSVYCKGSMNMLGSAGVMNM